MLNFSIMTQIFKKIVAPKIVPFVPSTSLLLLINLNLQLNNYGKIDWLLIITFNIFLFNYLLLLLFSVL